MRNTARGTFVPKNPEKLEASLASLTADDAELQLLEDAADFSTVAEFDSNSISNAEIFEETEDLNIAESNVYEQNDEDDSTTTYYA